MLYNNELVIVNNIVNNIVINIVLFFFFSQVPFFHETVYGSTGSKRLGNSFVQREFTSTDIDGTITACTTP